MSGANGHNKVRVDINVTAETKRLLDGIIDFEQQEDRKNDRPERSKSEVLEMVLRKGAHAWPGDLKAVTAK
jgi:hypothetical protein